MTEGLNFDIQAITRPGFKLAYFKDAALPVYQLTAKVLTLDKKPISPIEEGCLNAINAGLGKTSQISEFLGLDGVVLNTVLASLNQHELINYVGSCAGEASATLTLKGKAAVDAACMSVPHERIIKIQFDPYLKRVVFHQGKLWRPKEVKSDGRLEVPLCGAKRPEVDDVPLGDIDRVLERIRRPYDDPAELLAIRRIERREMLFVPCTLLYFRSEAGSETQVAFHFDEGISLDHENAFRNLGGVDEVGAKHVLADKATDTAGTSALDSAVSEELSRLPAGTTTKRCDDPALIDSSQKSVNPTLEEVRCHQHPGILEDALLNSKDRLLIISPWIRDQIVNTVFIKRLESLLRSSVKVFIGYGLDEGNGRGGGKSPITPNADRNLKDLQKRFKNFTFVYIGNTHRKLLVSDNRYAVSTSFNWLSFRGDPKDTPRDEFGTRIFKQDYVEKYFQDGLDLLQKGYGSVIGQQHSAAVSLHQPKLKSSAPVATNALTEQLGALKDKGRL